MQGKKLIHCISIKNFLSLGGKEEIISLKPLNVLIGANASGKSNFIEAFRLLRALTGDFAQAIRNGGGIGEYISKCEYADSSSQVKDSAARIEVTFSPTHLLGKDVLVHHKIGFTKVGQSMEIINESIDEIPKSWNEGDIESDDEPITYYFRISSHAELRSVDGKMEILQHGFTDSYLKTDQSIITQIKDPAKYPYLTFLYKSYEQIKIYEGWRFRQQTAPRTPAHTSMPSDFLFEDAQNLALVLNSLDAKRNVSQKIIELIRNLYPEIERIITKVQDSTVQIYAQESRLNELVSASRLSDGTRRFLCLLSILCHPTPPPLICIEEPEIGLHPDVISTVAKLLIEASKRTQLIVTTHSDILVSAIARLSDSPEPILICERDNEGTHLRRLEKEKLSDWLEEYSLGELWLKGEIGGTRW